MPSPGQKAMEIIAGPETNYQKMQVKHGETMNQSSKDNTDDQEPKGSLG